MRRGWAALGSATALVLALGGCTGGGGPAPLEGVVAEADRSKVSGSITVLTNRVDQVNSGLLKKYAAEFNELYPKVEVHFEGFVDYEGEVGKRLAEGDYGDVLLIPDDLPAGQFPTYFASLGNARELSDTFDYIDYGTVDERVYGIANIGIASGMVYNKAVWAQAGITEWPATPDRFLADLKAIKERTGAIPYYTNYHDGWPLRQWTDAIGVPSCDNTARDKLAATAAPWAPGGDLHEIDGLLYRIVHGKLAESEPQSTDWEQSKKLLGTGRVATMELGSWAIAQMREAARDAGADPDDIGFMPLPVQHDGHFCTVVQPDYKYAVNVHSAHQDAAKAWLEWYVTRSGSAAAEESISAVRGARLPASLQPLDDRAVRMIPQTREQLAKVDAIDRAAGIGLDAPDYRRKLVDLAAGTAPGDLDSYFADLNRRWGRAQKAVG
ncbi:ABC transporter substrate-binding protein [Kitasatospora phosalacinea]|uniref:Sugar ABC transporter substrate-binding protein n=1 Tax=Kitasatospora phosalacinea TaxID=2065 RepID=A0A9W6PMP1_9ACTN|nr:extracellular solute-binding protein [Kitasatospora phosalacinea]GLW57668.1 sugar ABC transporter substrate-binding protein [Kitasatospora phosalacinea]